MTERRWDVLIVGSGAGGGPLALTLAEAGAEVLVLEKGPRYSRAEYRPDEVAIGRRDFWLSPPEEELHTLLRAGEEAAQPTQLGWTSRCVGGGTVQMGSYLYRFHPDDFRLRSRCGEYLGIADWPYDYAELEPYYSQAEWQVGVSGQAGANPFEGARSRPYPLPPLDVHPLCAWLDRAAEKRGVSAFVTPRGILSQPYEGRPACTYCAFCAGYGCAVGAKASSQEALLPRAEATGRCEVRPGAMVREVTVDRAGRADGCCYLDAEGREHRVRARVVCVCCSAVESARLLLLSRSARFPDGLGNGNGQVGRHLQFHGFSNGQARFRYDRHGDKPLRDGNPFFDRSVMDYYFLPPGVSDLPKGGLIRYGLPGASPIAAAVRAAEEAGTLLWGQRLQQRLRECCLESRTVDFEVFHDFIPNAGTYVDLDPHVQDRWGLPVARIHLEQPEHHRRAGAWLVERGLELLADLGADQLLPEEAGELASFLVLGTCRAGHDAVTSVLNPHCQSHEVPNLFVVDGSFMPTSGGAPPTLTILANSFRTADHIADRLRAGDFA